MTKRVRTKEADMEEQLRRAVAGCGLSQSQLGKAAGVNQAQLSRFLSKKRTLTLAAASRLCAYLGMRLTDPTRKQKGKKGGRG